MTFCRNAQENVWTPLDNCKVPARIDESFDSDIEIDEIIDHDVELFNYAMPSDESDEEDFAEDDFYEPESTKKPKKGWFYRIIFLLTVPGIL